MHFVANLHLKNHPGIRDCALLRKERSEANLTASAGKVGWTKPLKQESPPIAGAVRNATALIPQRLSSIIRAITCSENVHACYVRVDRDNNTPPFYVMHRSIPRKSQSTIYVTPFSRWRSTKISNRLHKIKWSPWITVSKTVNLFRIDWTVVE